MANNPLGYGQHEYDEPDHGRAMPAMQRKKGNPYGYGQVEYDDEVAKKKAEKKEHLEVGDLAIWPEKKIVGKVTGIWRGYGLQLEHVDPATGKMVTTRVPEGEAKPTTLMDAIARNA